MDREARRRAYAKDWVARENARQLAKRDAVLDRFGMTMEDLLRLSAEDRDRARMAREQNHLRLAEPYLRRGEPVPDWIARDTYLDTEDGER